MRYQGARWTLDLPLPSLTGAHQIANAGTAIACLEQLASADLPPAAIADGLRHIDWPARLQRLSARPSGRDGAGLGAMARWRAQSCGGRGIGRRRIALEPPTLASRRRYAEHKGLHGLSATACAAGGKPSRRYHSRRREPAARRRDRRCGASSRHSGDDSGIDRGALRAISGSGDSGLILICGSLHLAGVVLRDNG